MTIEKISRVFDISQINLLPLEIQHEILGMLTTQERWRMSSVCMSWRSMVLNWQPHWHTLPTNEEYLIALQDLGPYTKYIQPHAVKYLSIQDSYSNKNYLSQLLDFVSEQKYHGISKVDFSRSLILTVDFLKLTAFCGNALTELRITTYQLGTDPASTAQIDLFLRHCPNLVKLLFFGVIYNVHTWNSNLLTDLKHTKLSELSLQHANAYIDDSTFIPNFLIPFLGAVPKLKRLHLMQDNFRSNPIEPSIWLDQMQEACPELTTLAFSFCSPNDNIFNTLKTTIATTPIATTSSSVKMPKNTRGLKHVLIQGSANDQQLSKKILIAIVQKHSQTIESLNILGSELLDENGAMSYMSSKVAFPALTRLKLALRTNEPKLKNPSPLETFFERSVPNLNSLSSTDVPFSRKTFLSLYTGAKYLRELELWTIYGITEEQISDYLNMVGPQLDVLALRMEILTPRTFDVIFSKCIALRELIIQTSMRKVMIYLSNFLGMYIAEEAQVGNKLQTMKVIFKGRPSQYPKNPIINTLLSGMDIKAIRWDFSAFCPPRQKMPYATYNSITKVQKFTHSEYRRYMREQLQ